MKTIAAKMAGSTMIFVLFFTGCSGGSGGGSGDSGDSSTSGSSNNEESFITCTAPYLKCVEIDSSDGSNIRFTFPQLKVRIQPALGTGYFFYEIVGSTSASLSGTTQTATYREEALIFVEGSSPVTQNGLTVEYSGGPVNVYEFWLTWESEKINLMIGGTFQRLMQGSAHLAGIEVLGNFNVVATGTEFLVIDNAPDALGLYPNRIQMSAESYLTFETYGEQQVWSDTNLLITWLGDYNFLIDY